MSVDVSGLFIEPGIVHRLGLAIRFVDRFTGSLVTERQVVRLVDSDWWQPVFRREDATYRFVVSNRPVPVIGAVNVTVTPATPGSIYRSHVDFQVTIPPAGPVPSPLTAAHFLVQRPLWPTRKLRIPARETVVVGRLLRAGQPLPDHRVLFRVGGAPGPNTPEAWTDEHGEFLFRLPDLRMRVNPTVTTADVRAAVTERNGAARVIATPAFPLTVPIGRVTRLTMTVL